MAELTKVDYGIEKYCPVCGARIYAKTTPSGVLESKYKFAQRKCCSTRCGQKARTGKKYKFTPKCTPGKACFKCPYPDCLNENFPMTHVESIMRKCGELPEEEPKSCTIAEIHLDIDINIAVSIPQEEYYE